MDQLAGQSCKEVAHKIESAVQNITEMQLVSEHRFTKIESTLEHVSEVLKTLTESSATTADTKVQIARIQTELKLMKFIAGGLFLGIVGVALEMLVRLL